MKKIKLGLIVPKIKLANTKYNTESITKDVKDAIENGAKINAELLETIRLINTTLYGLKGERE